MLRDSITINVIFLLLQTSNGRRKLDIYFTGIDCPLWHHNIVVSYKCELLDSTAMPMVMVNSSSNRTMTSTTSKRSKLKIATHPRVNAHLLLSRDVDDIKIHYKFLIKRYNRYDTYLSTVVDVCEILSQALSFPLFRYVRDQIHKKGNFPIECPLRKNIIYGFENFTLDTSFLPPYTPAMYWDSRSDIWMEGKKAFSYNTFGKIVWVNV